MDDKSHRKWAVMVDGSAVSAKAFDAACHFVCKQGGKEGDDHLSLIHCYDPALDAAKPFHLHGPFILSSYESNLFRARRLYDSLGLKRLKTRLVCKEYISSSGDVELSVAHSVKKETAPSLIAALLRVADEEVQPQFIFAGSFGEGGNKIGCNGTVTDHLVRLSNSTTFIINHWRPLPPVGSQTTFVVALDGNETSRRGLAEVLRVAQPTDRITGVLVAKSLTQREQDMVQQVEELVQSFRTAHGLGPASAPACRFVAYSDTRKPVAQVICDAAEQLEADFLAVGSFNLRPGSAGRSTMPLVGSTALYCSHNARCHVIVVKPGI